MVSHGAMYSLTLVESPAPGHWPVGTTTSVLSQTATTALRPQTARRAAAARRPTSNRRGEEGESARPQQQQRAPGARAAAGARRRRSWRWRWALAATGPLARGACACGAPPKRAPQFPKSKGIAQWLLVGLDARERFVRALSATNRVHSVPTGAPRRRGLRRCAYWLLLAAAAAGAAPPLARLHMPPADAAFSLSRAARARGALPSGAPRFAPDASILGAV